MEKDAMIGEIDFKEYAEMALIVKHHWRTIMAIACLFTLGVTIFFLRTPMLFESTVHVMLERMEKNTVGVYQDLVIPQFSGEEDYYGTQTTLLTSRSLMRRTAEELNLGKNVELDSSTGNALFFLKSSRIGKHVYFVSAKRKRLSRLITLSVVGPDAKKAPEIANKIAELYVQDNAKQNLYMSQQIFKWLSGEDSQHLQVDPETFASTLSSVNNDPSITALRKERQTVAAKIAEYTSRYRPKHPIMKELHESLARIDSQIRSQTDVVLNNLRASLNGQLGMTNVRVIEWATAPAGATGPNRATVMLCAFLVGLFCGSFFVVLNERLNQKIRSEADLPLSLKNHCLGIIPFVQELKSAGSKKIAPIPDGILLPDLLAKDKVFSDAVVNLRVQAILSMPYEEAKKILVMSAIPGEGKSIIASVLAISLANAGRKILLVDADLRKPSLYRLFGGKEGPGLTDYLVANATADQIIRTTPVNGLFVIPAGSATSNSAALLSSERLHQLIEKLGVEYDRIIFDTPPLLDIPDAMILMKWVSAGLLVCGSKIVNKSMVRKAKNKIDFARHKFMGVVISQMEMGKLNKTYLSYKMP